MDELHKFSFLFLLLSPVTRVGVGSIGAAGGDATLVRVT
jgi:hypothetical protein